MKTFLYTYICSTLLALIITPVVIYLARKLDVMDSNNARKVHSGPIPRIGGLAVFLASIIPVIAVLFLNNDTGRAFRAVHLQTVTLLAVGAFFFAVGLIDDLRSLKARYKLLAQIFAASVMCLAGVRIESLNVANLFTINFGWLAFPVTIFWIISITNAVNLIDGLDGLAAGISAVACIIIAILAFNTANPLMVVFTLALLGSLSGFLVFNFNPARIFLGDCGSMFIGFVLASASIMCAMKSGTVIALALPALALGLPIFDTIFTMLRRYLYRWGIMTPDRSHLHHKLLDMGLRHHHVVIVMYAITIIIAGLGMFMMISSGGATLAIFFCIILLLVLVFRAAGAVKLDEVVTRLQRKKMISKEVEKDIDIFHSTSLKMRTANSFKKWWLIVCEAAQIAGFSKIRLVSTAGSGKDHIFTWTSSGN